MPNLTKLTINLANLGQNIRNLKNILKSETKFVAGKTEPGTLFMAVVKANAYGHGLVEISRAAVTAGADWLGVNNIDEAVALRDHQILKPILVLGYTSADDMRLAANKDISITIVSFAHGQIAAEINFDKPLKVHLKVDTGMNRLGVEFNEIEEVVRILKTNHNIVLEGVFSHVASAEKNNLAYAQQQIQNFKSSIKTLKNLGENNLLKHFSATAATFMLPKAHFDMVRCGISIYGLWPSTEIKASFNQPDFLAPVLTYKTAIIQIKKVLPGEKIGYGCSFEVKNPMKIAVIPIGYHDGFDRGLSNKGEVLVGGEHCPVVGRICMSMSMIDISSVEARLGDEVVIIGRQGEAEITAEDIAEKIDTSNYEIVTRLPEHLPRNYT